MDNTKNEIKSDNQSSFICCNSLGLCVFWILVFLSGGLSGLYFSQYSLPNDTYSFLQKFRDLKFGYPLVYSIINTIFLPTILELLTGNNNRLYKINMYATWFVLEVITPTIVIVTV